MQRQVPGMTNHPHQQILNYKLVKYEYSFVETDINDTYYFYCQLISKYLDTIYMRTLCFDWFSSLPVIQLTQIGLAKIITTDPARTSICLLKGMFIISKIPVVGRNTEVSYRYMFATMPKRASI